MEGRGSNKEPEVPTVLDDVLESHEGPEPRVLTEDVQAILNRVIRPNDGEGDGVGVALIAFKAGVSTRSVYRVLNPAENKPTIGLDLADRLCLAAGAHLRECRLVWPSGAITDYF
jgi:hypothetical protein